MSLKHHLNFITSSVQLVLMRHRGKSGGNSQRKIAQNDILTKLAIEGLRSRITRQKIGGGGQIRTVDAADMSRVDIDPKLLELLTEVLLEATVGDIREP